MNIESVYRPVNRVASIIVRLSEVPESSTIEEIKFLAYRAAGEVPEMCFGSHVSRHDEGCATVAIHRD